jgi:hypothetical protein
MTEGKTAIAIAIGVALALADAFPVHAQNKCAGSKIKAVAKKASCLLGLDAKQAKSGLPKDPARVSQCGSKMVTSFGKAEAKPPCLTNGDATAIESKVDAFVADVDTELSVGLPNGCAASKLKAAGKKTKCLLGLEAKEAIKNTPVDPLKVQKCIDKFEQTFAKAEARGDCNTAGDTSAIEAKVDAFVADVDGELVPGATTTTVPTTSTTATSSTTTSTTEPSTSTTETSTTTTTSSTTTTTTTSSTTTTSTTSTTTTTSTTVTTTTCPLPATGQTTCWNSSGMVIACAGTGHDGELQKGAPLSYTDNGDGTVTDNNTGLVWEKKSDDGSVNDKDTLYTWGDAFAVHVANLNTASFAGHNDWRVPNIRELESIVHYQSASAVSSVFSSGCTPGCSAVTCSCNPTTAWSSTTGALSTDRAWRAESGLGVLSVALKGNTQAVRAVRGGGSCLPATGQTTCWNSSGAVVPCAGTGHDGELQKGAPLSYTHNGDGTIADNVTGLVWEKKSDDGGINDVDTTYSWTNAFAVHVAGLNAANFAGFNDWRLPNARELQSLVQYQSSPTVAPVFNTNCSSGCTVLTCSCTRGNEAWSSSSAFPIPADGWWTSFLFGNMSFYPKGTGLRVRAVRGGL